MLSPLYNLPHQFLALWGLLSQSLSQKSRTLISQLCYVLITASVSGAKQQKNRRQRDWGVGVETEVTGISRGSWAHSSSGRRGFFSLRILGTYLADAAVTIATASIAMLPGGWSGRWWRKKKRKQENFPHLIFRSLLPAPQTRKGVISVLLELYLPLPGVLFQVLGYLWVKARQNQGKINGKLNPSSVILQILVSFSNLLATV